MDDHLLKKLQESGLCKDCIKEVSKEKFEHGQYYRSLLHHTICKDCSIIDLQNFIDYERNYLKEMEDSGISFKISEELEEKLKNIMEFQNKYSEIGIHKMTDFTFVKIGRLILNRTQLTHIFATEEFEIGASFINGQKTIFLKCENEEEVFEKLDKIAEILQLPL